MGHTCSNSSRVDVDSSGFGGQSARLSSLRLRVRFSERTFSMLLEPSAPLMEELVNSQAKIVGFFRALRFPPTGKSTGWVRVKVNVILGVIGH